MLLCTIIHARLIQKESKRLQTDAGTTTCRFVQDVKITGATRAA